MVITSEKHPSKSMSDDMMIHLRVLLKIGRLQMSIFKLERTLCTNVIKQASQRVDESNSAYITRLKKLGLYV